MNIDEKKLIVVQEDPQLKEPVFLVEMAKRYGWHLLQVDERLLIPPKLKPIGALLTSGLESKIVKRAKQLGLPFVRVGSFPYFYVNGMPSVSVDIANCGKVGANFFADRGFKNLAFIANDPWGESQDLYDQFKKTAELLGCVCHLYQRPATQQNLKAEQREKWLEKRDEAMLKWLDDIPKPVGLLAYNDKFAARLSLLFFSNGFRIPDDISVLGVGNQEFRCETSLVPISSIEHSWKDMWQVSFKMLNDLILGKTPPKDTIYVPAKGVVERASTHILPVHDKIVAEVLKFIWQNFYKNISSEDFVAVAKVSRSTLERRFKNHLGRTLNEELRRKRIEVAERLLSNTDQSVSDISEQVGFNSRNHFYKVFEEIHGTTPAEYRRERKEGVEKKRSLG